MKSYQTYLNEIKSTVPRSKWSWSQLGVNGGEAIWFSDQGTIHLVIEADMPIEIEGEPFNTYTVAFTRDGEWNQTNQGGAEKIFPWVVERIKEFLELKPEIIRFTAKKEELSRIRLYDTMVKFLLRQEPDYELIELPTSTWRKGKPYYIVHEEITFDFEREEIERALINHNSTYA